MVRLEKGTPAPVNDLAFVPNLKIMAKGTP
jgi:hypothetical protein